MKPIDQYRRLLQDLRDNPTLYFDCDSPSTLDLEAFFSGYVQGDPMFFCCKGVANDIIAARYSCRLSIDAARILYMAIPDLAKGYDLFISALLEALGSPEAHLEVEERQPLQTSLRGMLPNLRVRAAMLTGSWDIRDLYTFFQGFFRALEDCGHDTTKDRRDLDAFEKHIQTDPDLNAHVRWDRLLFVMDGGGGRSAANFAELFEEASRKLLL